MLRSALQVSALTLALVSAASDLLAQKGMVQSGNRAFCRYLEFSQENGEFSIPVQFTFEYSPMKWKDEFGEALKGAKKGARLRFGKDVWSTFDTNKALTIGGKSVPVGHYCLAVEKGEGQEVALVLLDSAAIRTKRLDPFQTPATEGGIVIPLKNTPENDKNHDLNITITNPDGKGDVAIHFGPNRFTAPYAQAK